MSDKTILEQWRGIAYDQQQTAINSRDSGQTILTLKKVFMSSF